LRVKANLFTSEFSHLSVGLVFPRLVDRLWIAADRDTLPCLHACGDAQLMFEPDGEELFVPIEFALRPKNDRHVADGHHVHEDTHATDTIVE
jgi:hypothetical protein